MEEGLTRMKETVMITGAGGFIGSYVVNLLKDKYNIYSVEENVFDIDFKDYMNRVKPEYLIHLAWVTGQGYLDSKENLYMVSKSIEMFEQFYANGGKRAVYVGTEQEYARKEDALTEEDELKPLSLYAQCKCNLGEMLVKAAKIYGYGFVWNRLFFIYGQGEKPKRLMPAIIKGMIRGDEVECSYENYVRDYIHVYDVATAIITSLFSDYTGFVNVCGGGEPTIGEIGRIIMGFDGAKGTMKHKTHQQCNQPMVIKGDNSLLKSLGWKPKYSLEEGLLEEFSYYKRMYEDEQSFLDE